MTTRSTAASLFVSLRPDQWTKNLIVFAALIFAVKLLDPAATAKATAAFLIFCALSGAVYLVNDVSDREQDRQHPIKRLRPIASGDLSPGTALVAAAVLERDCAGRGVCAEAGVRGGGGGLPRVVRRLYPLAEAHRRPGRDDDRRRFRAAGGGGRIGD